jgi:hypothetical protein
MDILRVAGSDVLYKVTGLSPNETYDYTITDLADSSVTDGIITTTSLTYATIELPSDIDGEYAISIPEVVEETVSVIRPYTNPNSLGTTASEIEEYTTLEMVARSMIDTYAENHDFYNRKITIQTTGQGGDYIPLWNGINRVLKVYENNVLVYDANSESNLANYSLTPDKTAIQRAEVDEYNRSEAALRYLAASGGDLWQDFARLVAFPQGYDYTLVLDAGYKKLPSDIEYATKLLIDDLKCGKLEYYKRYTTQYSTDQYRIQFDKSILDGTGNLLVDKILDKYLVSIQRPGLI